MLHSSNFIQSLKYYSTYLNTLRRYAQSSMVWQSHRWESNAHSINIELKVTLPKKLTEAIEKLNFCLILI